jgi:hypothetical protein
MGLPVVLNGVDRVDDMKIACGVGGSFDLQGRHRDTCAEVVRPGPMVPVDLPGPESRMRGRDYGRERMKMVVEVYQGVSLRSMDLRKWQRMAR